MQPYLQDGRLTLYHGDNRAILPTLPDHSVDAVVTDPPYGLLSSGKGGFMGLAWDATGIANDVAMWAEVLRVAKPGAHLLAFGGTRTYHRMTCAIEDAGWEIRDCIVWLHGQGFPKSLSVSKALDKAAGAEREIVGTDAARSAKLRHGMTNGHYIGGDGRAVDLAAVTAPATDLARQWDGWGTALKPAMEPIVLARAPLSEPTVADNVARWSVGALNIDATRIGTAADLTASNRNGHAGKTSPVHTFGPTHMHAEPTGKGRWPANVVLSHSPECRLVSSDSGQDVGHDGEHISSISDVNDVHVGNVTGNVEGHVALSVSSASVLNGVQFDTEPKIREPEVNNERAAGVGNDVLPFNNDSESTEGLSDDRLDSGHGQGVASGVTLRPMCREANSAALSASNLAGDRAEHTASRAPQAVKMNRKKLAASSAQVFLPGFGGPTPIDIGASAGAGSTAPMMQNGVRDAISNAANGTVAVVPGHGSPPQDYTTPQPETVEAWACAEDCPVFLLDQQSGERKSGGQMLPARSSKHLHNGGWARLTENGFHPGDTGGASRFFYVAKPSRRERDRGLSDGERNQHPTVKSIELMRYLVRLITPPGGTVLDPFAGSGSTLIAACEEGMQAIGIEMDAGYYETAHQRIAHHA